MIASGKLDVRALCLGILTFGDATGYEIRAAVRDVLGAFQGASFGSIYPALAKALAAGEVVCRDASAPHGLEKRTYGITEVGQAAFRRALDAAKGGEVVRSEFLTAMFFAHLLAPEDIDRLMDERLASLRVLSRDLTRLQGGASSEGQRFCARYSQVVTRAAIDFLQGEGRAIASQAKRSRQG